jgi:hypothetical protein
VTTSKISLSESDAAEAFARMWNRCDLAAFMHLKIARNATMTMPVWSDAAPAKLRIQTFRGRNMLAAMLLMMVEHVLAEAMRQPGHTVRAELATLDWEGRKRPVVVLGCWNGTTSQRVAIFGTGPAGITQVELLLDGGLNLEMSGVVPL